jgi:hypothetical protein
MACLIRNHPKNHSNTLFIVNKINMRPDSRFTINVLFAVILLIGLPVAGYSNINSSPVPTPESHFGFTPGDDRMLFTYEEMISYMKKLEDLSPMVKMEQIGHSEMGRPMYLLFVSSAENISNLDLLKDINRQLALEPDLSGPQRRMLVDEGKVFFLMTLSMHSTEVAPSQAAPLIIHEMITSDDPR